MLPVRVLGCVAFVHLHKNQRSKLDPCAVCCVFLGYAVHKKGYRCYDPTTSKMYETMDVTFLESETYFSSASNSSLQREIRDIEEKNWSGLAWPYYPTADATNGDADGAADDENTDATNGDADGGTECPTDSVSGASPAADGAADNETADATVRDADGGADMIPSFSVPDCMTPENVPEVSTPTDPILDTIARYVLPDRSNWGKLPTRYSLESHAKRSKYPIANYMSTHRLFEPLEIFVNNVSTADIPKDVHAAFKDPNWTQAIKDEMSALQKNDTWQLVSLPDGKKTVGCKWVFTIKYKADGSIDRYKARLVAKGYTQTYGIDY